MTETLFSCPFCGALPCDWTDDPHHPSNRQVCLDGSTPLIGDRREFDGVQAVWMPDPWAWNVTFFAWCSLAELERDKIIIPDEPKP
jgi:hypothetical protein